MKIVRIATRNSPLAVAQAEQVRAALRENYPGLAVELRGMTTRGDRILDAPLAKIGGKGLFIKELEQGLLAGEADLAVHSMKDVPIEIAPGLEITAILRREDPRDGLLSPHQYPSLAALPPGASIGTSSLRRHCQIRSQRPDLIIRDLRGNINTRLKRFDDGEFSAIILACAGLRRLRMDGRITQILEINEILPAIGQGAIGIECRSTDVEMRRLIAPLHDPETALCVSAERSLNSCLLGGCQVPIGAYAELRNTQLHLRALVGNTDGTQIIRGEIRGLPENAIQLGIKLAEELIGRGAKEILASINLSSII